VKVVFIFAMCQKQGDHTGKTWLLSTSHLGYATLPQPKTEGTDKPFFKTDLLVPLGRQGVCVQEIHRLCYSSFNRSCLPAIALVVRALRAVLISPAQPNVGPARGPGPYFTQPSAISPNITGVLVSSSTAALSCPLGSSWPSVLPDTGIHR